MHGIDPGDGGTASAERRLRGAGTTRDASFPPGRSQFYAACDIAAIFPRSSMQHAKKGHPVQIYSTRGWGARRARLRPGGPRPRPAGFGQGRRGQTPAKGGDPPGRGLKWGPKAVWGAMRGAGGRTRCGAWARGGRNVAGPSAARRDPGRADILPARSSSSGTTYRVCGGFF